MRPKCLIWTTQHGERIPVSKMGSTHIFYAIRMIWNYTVPPADQIPNCQRYSGPETWTLDHKKRVLLGFIMELTKRPATDLTPDMWAQLAFMAQRAQQWRKRKVIQN
jgi:hypothetical protein